MINRIWKLLPAFLICLGLGWLHPGLGLVFIGVIIFGYQCIQESKNTND